MCLTSLTAHGGIRKLFGIGLSRGEETDDVIFRIDPVSGRIELHWLIDNGVVALAAAGDKLLATICDCLHEYSVDGTLLRVFATNWGYCFPMQSHPHESGYLVSGMELQLVQLRNDGTVRTVFSCGSGFSAGCVFDSRACVVLLEKITGEERAARLAVFHAGETLKSRELLRIHDDTLAESSVSTSKEMILDDDRGLLFVFTRRSLLPFHKEKLDVYQLL